MKFSEYFISNDEGKSNCVIRTFCKLLNESYDNIYNDLSKVAKELKCNSYNEVIVFETFMKRHNINKVKCDKGIRVKDLNLENGIYVVFCYDKKDFYHMVPIIDNTLYDKDNKSLDLYVITLYKRNL